MGPTASTEPLCQPPAAGTIAQSRGETLSCTSSGEKSGPVLWGGQDADRLPVLPQVQNRARLMPPLDSGRRARVCSSRPVQSHAAFLFISVPRTDTGASARRPQQRPGKRRRAWPREQAARLGATGSNTAARGARPHAPPSSALRDASLAVLQGERKARPSPREGGQRGSLREKALLSPEPPGHKAREP